MGSSVSGNYSGTQPKSQPYSKYYGVEKDMLQLDKDRGVYDDTTGYDKNPAATNITNTIKDDQIGFVGKDGKWRPYSGNLTYVIDEHGNIIVGKRNGRGFDGPATPHPTLIGGKNPKVKMAGILKVENGKIVKYDNQSGHFKPNEKSTKEADKAFGKLSKNLFI